MDQQLQTAVDAVSAALPAERGARVQVVRTLQAQLAGELDRLTLEAAAEAVLDEEVWLDAEVQVVVAAAKARILAARAEAAAAAALLPPPTLVP